MKKINLGILRQGLKHVIEKEAPEQFGEERFYVVVNSNIAAHLYDVKGFKPDSSDKILGGKKPYHIGMLFDEDIYCDPVLPWDLKVEIRENLCDNTKGKLVTINFLCAVECEEGHEDAIFEKIEKYLDFFGEDDECEEEETDDEEEVDDELDERLGAIENIAEKCCCDNEQREYELAQKLKDELLDRAMKLMETGEDVSTQIGEINYLLHLINKLTE